MRQPRTDREPGPPPAFQQSTHKNQSTSFLSHLPDFGKCKTLSISCQNTVNFIGLSGSGRARGALVPCLMPFLPNLLRPNLLRPIAFRRKKQMKRRYYACFTQSSDTSSMHHQCTIFWEGCQRRRFSHCGPNLLFVFWKSVIFICAISALNSDVYVWYISGRVTYHLTELGRSAIGAGCKMPQGTPGRKGSSSVIFSRKSSIQSQATASGDFPALSPVKSKALGTGDPLIVRDLFQGLDRTTDGRITSFRCTGIILCPQVKKVNCLLC